MINNLRKGGGMKLFKRNQQTISFFENLVFIYKTLVVRV